MRIRTVLRYVWKMCMFVTATLVAQEGRPYVSSLIGQVSADSLIQHVAVLSDAGGWQSRMNFTPGNDSARKYIERQLQSRLGISVERDSFFVLAVQPFDAQPLMNVSGELNGGVGSDLVVVGAHYDSQAGRESDWRNNWQSMSAPGADDNASGVAGVLEIARVLSANWDSTMMRRGVLFAFFAAEEGTTPGYAS
ncbi:MAG: M20/M25/M40 family metallo-hydrolase, partial [Bacteroidetes bacterium]|nr:M20/M25/M40 family metallo-hydrolase [Bacteroidota bacterium]